MATWKQAIREQREGPKPEAPPAVVPGRCEKCGASKFSLSAIEVKGKLTRTCECRDKKYF